MAELFGTMQNEIPSNADLGTLAYQNHNEVEIDNGRVAVDEYQKAYTAPKIKPTLNLPFARMTNFDPRVSFSRASDAYAYEGDSQKAEENLVLYSEQFDNARWSKVRVTVLPNQTLAPNGTNTSDLLAETADTGQHYIENNPLVPTTAGLTYVNSWYVKKGIGATAPDIVQLIMATNGFGATVYANFNIANGTLGTVVGGTATITPAANGFYRISLSAVATATSNVGASAILVFTNNDDGLGRFPSYAGQTTSDVFVWGAQLEQRDTLTDYQRTTDRIIQKYIDTYSLVTSNKPRFKEIDPVTKERKGLLVEEARTNLLLQSNTFLQSPWVANLTIIEGVPSNIGNSVKLVAGVGSAPRSIFQSVSVTAGTKYTVSIYVKFAGQKYLQILFNGAISNDYANFDVEKGQVVGGSFSGDATVDTLDNNWYRISLSFTALDTVSQIVLFQLVPAENSGRAVSITGDGYSGIYISQAQLEVGSFATSPILTGASAVTRSGDTGEVPISSFTFNQTGGTLQSSVNFENISDSTYASIAYLFSATSRGFSLGFSQFNSVTAFARGDANVLARLDSNSVQKGDRVEIAASLGDELILAKDSKTQEISFVKPYPNFSTLKIANGLAGGVTANSQGRNFISQISYYPQALNAQELAFLTRNTSDE